MTGRREMLVALAAAALSACGGAGVRGAAPLVSASARGPAVRFAYEGIDGRPISSEAFANRVSVIGFLTTYDVHSQVQARFLAGILAHHTPRLNVGALMLEAPENRPLVEAFARSLGVPYPIALADADTIAGVGPFAGMHHVPGVVILDRQGREAFRRLSLIDEAGLEAALREVEKGE